MDAKSLARLAAVIFAAIAVTAAAVELARREEKSVRAAPEAPATLSPNPLREGLRRCQILGGAALRDGDCLRLWAQQRDRFLGLKSPFARPTPETAAPQLPDAASQGAR
ncbi:MULTISPECIES: putative entry exclusion protein TrbK-alt [unclassified Mesorhizobium]|uniref:putative entry exclusion protein TrbK-alt n=1 Tax=unclassified Mesorhizobium TaxID=325217 RepID=UPI000F760A3B|nr:MULTISPECIES: putative entry exclusion protein TrbK-alt [unclassified Mesorhizobium]AZO55780.1 conjugal transfer protein TrbK [Mesorhizobium sp. M8A.F.Ca.ET.057.01.1.1]RWE40359.1 MAG: conjugal transfer protein TrbK [Mesorhizobium sp.]